jgi:phosphinothricin acetyltransferase
VVDEINVRAATESDVPAVLDIYNYYILKSIATFDVEPQTLDERLTWFHESTSSPYCVVVADVDGDVGGFASLGPFRSKAAYRYTAENSVYVRPERQGDGIGGALLARTVELAKTGGLRAIIARIAGDNPASVALHARQGFEHIGTERDVGYKFERWIDVVVMQLTLAD